MVVDTRRTEAKAKVLRVDPKGRRGDDHEFRDTGNNRID
jgi:hypothetical protein